MQDKTGVFILEHGEQSLIGRAWLVENATSSIDVQYFIWSTDNIGILASEALLSAAERGVKVRVLVDDLLVDAEDQTLVALAAHPNVSIKIYNPQHSVGISTFQRMVNILSDFKAINQRMHDKTLIVDGVAGITGGRNMADEYFDYNHHYNFRDRDILLLGPAVQQMQENFDEFWRHNLSHTVNRLLPEAMSQLDSAAVQQHQQMLHAYAADPKNYEPAVRASLTNLPSQFQLLVDNLIWTDAEFISDTPGKNSHADLGGGGFTTTQLTEALSKAQSTILIQTPYLVMPEGGIDLLARLVKKGVKIDISTNSLASTDNLLAFSGYLNQRDALLAAGVNIYEFKPNPAVQLELLQRYDRLNDQNPVFAIHAKTMLIDGEQLFIGTFNLDPRSANLNTEVGVLIDNKQLGQQVSASIHRDMQADSSWPTRTSDPDSHAEWTKRLHVWFYSWLPLTALL